MSVFRRVGEAILRNKFTVLPGIGILAGAIIAIVLFERFHVSAEQKALRESLVRADVAITTGVSYSEFGTLVREAATRYELAKPGLSSRTSFPAQTAIFYLSEMETFWGDILSCKDKVDGLAHGCGSQALVDTAQNIFGFKAYPYVIGDDDIKRALTKTHEELQPALVDLTEP